MRVLTLLAALTLAQAAPSDDPVAEVRTLSAATDNDGRFDTTYRDLNHDGRFELVEQDRNGDGKADRYLYQTDEDQAWDLAREDNDFDGTFESTVRY